MLLQKANTRGKAFYGDPKYIIAVGYVLQHVDICVCVCVVCQWSGGFNTFDGRATY